MRHTLVIVLTILVVGCSESADSNVELVAWTIGAEPAVLIGAPDGEEPYLLHEVQDIIVFGDGRIGVANGGSREVRLYDENGAYLGSVGRSGEGPGEFRSIASIDLIAGDSVVAFDPDLRRVSVFDDDGVYARSWTFESPGRGIYPGRARAFEDGTVLVAFLRGRMPGDPPGRFRQPAPVIRYSADGEEEGAIARMPGEEWYYSTEQGVLSTLPFGGGSHFAATRNLVYIGDGNELAVLSPRGDTLHTLHPFERRAVTRDDIDAEAARRLAGAPSDRQSRIQSLLAEFPYPDSLPTYSAVAAGDGDQLWLKLSDQSADQGSAWMVLTQGGEPIASIELPSTYTPHRVVDNRVIGVLKDSADVEYVVAYEVAND